MTSSTVSNESAPRSLVNDASGVTCEASTPSLFMMISLTFASTSAIVVLLFLVDALSVSVRGRLQGQPAVDANHLACHVLRVGRGEKADDSCDFLRTPGPF